MVVAGRGDDCAFALRLAALDLSWSPLVSDRTVESVLAGFPRLSSLRLSKCPKVTDRGLRKLLKQAAARQQRTSPPLLLVDVRDCRGVFVTDRRFTKALAAAAELMPQLQVWLEGAGVQ